MTFSDIRWGLFLGGLGLFLFGISLMGDSLKSIAGDKLRTYLDKYTSKPWQGLLIGAVMTAAIQSSSATTAICIGFIRAGLMSLEQSAGIIIGANIGTTITAFLIGLNIDQLSVYLIFIGAAILLFSNNKKLHDIAKVTIGFGLLFYSLSIMGDTLSELKNVPQFVNFAKMCTNNPLIGLFGGVILTICMQSSSASIGIIQLFYESGAITFLGVIPFLYGANVGTTITAIIASMGGKITAKRAAALHLSFNVIGCIIGLLMMMPLYHFTSFLASTFGINPMMQIAITHILFNLAATVVVFPFIKQLCAFVRKVLPGDEPKKFEVNIEELNPHNFPVASAALSAAYKFILEMKKIVKDNLENTRQYMNGGVSDEDDFDHIQETENIINKIDHQVTSFLTSLSISQLTQDSQHISTLYLEITKNLERIGDLSVNVAEFAKMVHDDNDTFSQNAYKELNEMFAILNKMLDQAFEFVETKEILIYEHILNDEAELDTLEYQSRKNHFTRLVKKECNGAVASSVYADILGNIERMGDHCCNIARNCFETYL